MRQLSGVRPYPPPLLRKYLPNPHGLVVRPGKRQPPIRRKCHADNPIGMPFERAQEPSRGYLPHPHGLSHAPERASCPSGENATLVTSPECPLSVRRRQPVIWSKGRGLCSVRKATRFCPGAGFPAGPWMGPPAAMSATGTINRKNSNASLFPLSYSKSHQMPRKETVYAGINTPKSRSEDSRIGRRVFFTGHFGRDVIDVVNDNR